MLFINSWITTDNEKYNDDENTKLTYATKPA
jgi:hypothetical protein